MIGDHLLEGSDAVIVNGRDIGRVRQTATGWQAFRWSPAGVFDGVLTLTKEGAVAWLEERDNASSPR